MAEISIIVPVYNVENYLENCIESILDQIYKDFELILINDGSVDKSGDICDKYSNQDSRVKVFHIENSGVSYARNFGVKKSKGRYIMFCDSDDIVEKEWCAKLYEEIINNKNSLIMSGFKIYNNRGGKSEIEKRFVDIDNTIITNKNQYFSKYKIKLLATVWNKIYEKKIIVDNNIEFNSGLSLGEDLIFNLDYLNKCNDKIIIIKDILYSYFLRDSESLDYKYYDNLYEIYSFLNNRIYEDAILYKANSKEFEKWYWKKYYRDFNRIITTNAFHEKNNNSLLMKIIYNTRIVKSKDFKRCILNLSEEDIDKELLEVLRTFNYIKIFMYFERLSYKDIFKKLKLKLNKFYN